MSFVGLYTGLTGVRAAQVGIDVTAHNVANTATPGYTRQRVELQARGTYQAAAGRIGTGVDVGGIARLRDTFLDARARTALAEVGSAAVRADLLGRMEALMGEPDGGLSLRFAALWTAAEGYANDPGDSASRWQLLSELGAVADRFRSIATQWTALGDDVTNQRDMRVTTTNDALTALADLDRRIANADPARVGSDLFDRRDQLLDEIASLTGASVGIGPDGRATVRLAGIDLLDPSGAGALSVAPDGTVLATAPDGTTAATTDVLGGELGGLVTSATVDLPRWKEQLDALASVLADAVNGINTTGVRADGTPGTPLLTYDPTDPAGTLSRATDAIADLAAAIDGAPPSQFDGSNARLLADLRTADVGGGGNLGARLSDLIVGLAGDVRSTRAQGDAAHAIAVGATQARSAEHGVSLDEEMVGLVRYQRALEAASRVMTTVDEALEVLVNRTGIVGR